MPPLRVFLLGGTTEASALAARLAADRRFTAQLSFAGATRAPRPPPVPWRVGGFGGVAGLAAVLTGFDVLLDATHPFAEQMKRHAVAAAAVARRPLLGVLRPAWQAVAGDRWTEVPDMMAAAHALGPTPRRVLLTVGQKDLAPFRAAPRHAYTLRSIDPPACPPDGARVIAARGPFDVFDEQALLVEHGIEILVTKNSGGSATAAKLAAARALGLRVVMVARPAPPAMDLACDVPGAWRWLEVHAAAPRGV